MAIDSKKFLLIVLSPWLLISASEYSGSLEVPESFTRQFINFEDTIYDEKDSKHIKDISHPIFPQELDGLQDLQAENHESLIFDDDLINFFNERSTKIGTQNQYIHQLNVQGTQHKGSSTVPSDKLLGEVAKKPSKITSSSKGDVHLQRLNKSRIADLLGKNPPSKVLREGIELGKGWFRKVHYETGKFRTNLLIAHHENSTTIISPYFILTVSSSTKCTAQSPLIKCCRDFMKPLSNSVEKKDNYMTRDSANHGIYAHMTKEGHLKLINPPKNETILIRREKKVYNLKDYYIFNPKFGDELFWIGTDKEDELVKIKKALDKDRKDCSLYGAVRKANKAKVLMTVYEKTTKAEFSDRPKFQKVTN